MSLEANGTYQHVNGKSEGGHGWSELNFQYAKLAQRLRTLQAMQNGFVQPERNPAFSHFSTNTSVRQNGYRNLGQSTEQSFIRELGFEIERVASSVAQFSDGLWAQLLAIADRLSTEAESVRASFDACASVGQDLVSLEDVNRENCIGMAKLAECWDRGLIPPELIDSSSDSQDDLVEAEAPNALYLECFRSKLQARAKIEPLLIALSDVYSHLRALEKGREHQNESWVPPDRFVRDTTKFWLKPEDVIRFKVQLIPHLPLFMFNRKESQTGNLKQSVQNLRAQSLNDWTTISSIYYDDREMQNYNTRLKRDDRATAIRVRFYGQREKSGNQTLFLERKTHRENWTGEKSCKERSEIAQEHIEPVMQCLRLPPPETMSSRDEAFITDVQSQIRATNQIPVLRTVCDRTAFQEQSTDLIRISLDTHLHMIPEMDAPRSPGDWCRDERAPVLRDALQFPYAVVEVKLQLEKIPAWIQQMVTAGILIHAPRFSKYLHGAAGLFPDIVERLPYWFLSNNDGSMSPATWSEMAAEDDNRVYEKEAAPWLFPKANDTPILEKMIRLIRKESKDSTSLEGKDHQSLADLQKQRAMQAREELKPRDSLGGSPRGIQYDPTRSNLNTTLEERGESSGGTSQKCLKESSVPQKLSLSIPEDAQQLSNPQEQNTPIDRLRLESDAAHSADPSHNEQNANKLVPHLPPLQYEQDDIEAHPSFRARGTNLKSSGTKENLAKVGTVSVGQQQEPKEGILGRTVGRFWRREGRDAQSSVPEGSSPRRKLMQRGVRSKAMVRSRVEPKTFFANERTFLSWLQISVLIMLTGLSLLGGTFSAMGGSGSTSQCTSDHSTAPTPSQSNAPSSFNCQASKYAGLVISPVAVLFMLYALYVYQKRTIQILHQRKAVRYDDQRGPVLLVVLLASALIVAMVFTANAAFGS